MTGNTPRAKACLSGKPNVRVSAGRLHGGSGSQPLDH